MINLRSFGTTNTEQVDDDEESAWSLSAPRQIIALFFRERRDVGKQR